MKRTAALLIATAALPTASAFDVASSVGVASRRFAGQSSASRRTTPTATTKSSTALGYSNGSEHHPILPDTADPFLLLGLDVASTSSKEIKNAYRKMTRLHHPDAVTNQDSTEEERRAANDNFARINSAYHALLTRQQAMEQAMSGEEFGAISYVDIEMESASHPSEFTSSWDIGGTGVAADTHWYEKSGQEYVEQREVPHDPAFQELFERKVHNKGNYRSASSCYEQYGSSSPQSTSSSDSSVDRSPSSSFSDLFEQSAKNFERYGRAGTRGTESSTQSPQARRKSSVSELFERSVRKFQRNGRASARPSSSPSAESSAAGGQSAARDRSVSELFARSAQNFERNGRNHPEDEYFFKTNAARGGRVGPGVRADNFFEINPRTNASKRGRVVKGTSVSADNFFETNVARYRSSSSNDSGQQSRSAPPPTDTSAPSYPSELAQEEVGKVIMDRIASEAKERCKPRNEGYAYSFGSEAAPAADPAMPKPAQTPESSGSYASTLREKERELEEKIAALRKDEQEAQARYESLTKELDTSESIPTSAGDEPSRSAVRNAFGTLKSGISFGVKVIGRKR